MELTAYANRIDHEVSSALRAVIVGMLSIAKRYSRIAEGWRVNVSSENICRRRGHSLVGFEPFAAPEVGVYFWIAAVERVEFAIIGEGKSVVQR